MKTLTTTQSATGRLTARETAAAIGGNLGDLIKFRHGGPKTRDPTFPLPVVHTYDTAEVQAWIKARDSQRSSPTAPLPVATTNAVDRRAIPDRRAR